MQPDDAQQRNKKCCLCDQMTSRVIGQEGYLIPVCDGHFTDGWGRLPSMPLPLPAEAFKSGEGESEEEVLARAKAVVMEKAEAEAKANVNSYLCPHCSNSRQKEIRHMNTSRIGKNHSKYLG